MKKQSTKLSAKSRAMLEKAKDEAHERVVKRGLIQFRADEELVDQLLKIADFKKIPVSVLVRSWVAEHVREEYPLIPLQQVKLPNGKTLTRDTEFRTLRDAIDKQAVGKLDLSPAELRTLRGWMLDLR